MHNNNKHDIELLTEASTQNNLIGTLIDAILPLEDEKKIFLQSAEIITSFLNLDSVLFITTDSCTGYCNFEEYTNQYKCHLIKRLKISENISKLQFNKEELAQIASTIGLDIHHTDYSFYYIKLNANKFFIFYITTNECKYIERIIFLIAQRIKEIQTTKQLQNHQKELENDLQKQYLLLSESALYSKTDVDGKILDVSDAFCELTGFSREELINENHNIMRHEDMGDEIFEELWGKLNLGLSWSGELKNKNKNGDSFWTFTDIKPEFNDDFEIISYIAIRTDITSKKQYEIQERALIEQSKLASMGEMIANIAHQWRQPLSMISTAATGTIVQMESNMLSQEKIIEKLETINDQAQYLSQTIDTFQNYLKEKKERRIVSLQTRVQKAIDIVSINLKNNFISLETNINEIEQIEYELVVGEFVQVLINILNNAKDALIKNCDEDKWIRIILSKESQKIVVSIEDNAGGIEEQILPHIFEPYFTTKNKSQGTGLGLYMSHQIVTQSLGGKIYAQNTKVGSKFSIELPL